MDFLLELAAFLSSRWQLWVRPILIALLIAAGVLVLAGAVTSVLTPASEDTLAPLSRNDYRHDTALFNRY